MPMYINIYIEVILRCAPLFFELSHLSQVWVHPATVIIDVSIFPPVLPWPFFVPLTGEKYFPNWGVKFPSLGRKNSLTWEKLRALGISLSHSRDLYVNFKKKQGGLSD